jgi:hypothetical protein
MWLVSKLLRLGVHLLLMSILSGCAFSYVDSQGTHHFIGVMHISMQGVEDDQRKAGDKVEVTNIGILVSHGPIYSGLSLGYTKESTMNLKNDVLVLLEDEGKKDKGDIIDE